MQRNKWLPFQRNAGVLCPGIGGVLCSGIVGYFGAEYPQGFNYTTWKPPTYWVGYVGGHSVKFIQINASGSERDDYEWSNFPEEVNLTIPYIIEAIDDF